MSDSLLFLFGLFATILTLGPLAIAALSELRDKDEQEQ
jgi:hypothetical protein